MLALSIIGLSVAALALIWWLSCSLRKAVFLGQPKKLLELEAEEELLPKGGHPGYSIIICSSFDNVQAELDKAPDKWRCVKIYQDGAKKYVFHADEKFFLYTIEWRHNLLEDKALTKKVLTQLEGIISKSRSVRIIVDVLPTFHFSRAIECSGENVREMSMFSRLADVLSRFEIYRFNEDTGRGKRRTAERGGKGRKDGDPAAKQVRFARQWLASTEDERVQLYALARGGFVNQNRIAVLSSLLNRGLIQVNSVGGKRNGKTSGDGGFNKVIALRDLEFGDYIRDNLDHDEFKAWQREGHGNIWRKIWPPLTVVAVLALLFFLNANPEALGILLALLGATVGAAPIAISLARSWRSSGQSDSVD